MSEASNDTRIGIQAKFPVKKRELNGLNRVAAFMNDNRVERVPVVGYVEFVKHTDTIDGDELTVSLVAVEPVIEPDGSDPNGHGATVRRMIEAARKGAGKAPIADTLFTGAQAKELDAELDGQIAGDDPGQALHNASGEPVAEKSGEEIMAERAEARDAAVKADGKRTEAAAARPDLKAAVTGKPSKFAGLTSEVDTVAKTTEKFMAPVVAAAEKMTGRTARGPRQRPATADPFTPGGGDAA